MMDMKPPPSSSPTSDSSPVLAKEDNILFILKRTYPELLLGQVLNKHEGLYAHRLSPYNPDH